MAIRGRRRLSPEEYQARLQEYCSKYSVTPLDTGLPPFPAGRRETPQHRAWIALYKVHNRLARRDRGQCERCSAPASDGTVFCEVHRGGASASAEDRRRLLNSQGGRCPICGHEVKLSDSFDRGREPGHPRALLHQPCHQFVALAEAFGPDALDRLRSHVWPLGKRRPRGS